MPDGKLLIVKFPGYQFFFSFLQTCVNFTASQTWGGGSPTLRGTTRRDQRPNEEDGVVHWAESGFLGQQLFDAWAAGDVLTE
jgi:hypothetical protein